MEADELTAANVITFFEYKAYEAYYNIRRWYGR